MKRLFGGMRLKHYLYVASMVTMVYVFLVLAEQYGWDAHVKAWLNLLLRWFHVIIGIAWIGASFYFVWLENHLKRTGVRDELAGNLWAVHGGGFYYLEKYKIAPKELPEKLHWFQWEAYLTWISGFFLMVVVYYSKPEQYLIDPSVLELPAYLAVLIGIACLFVAWLIYDALCRSSLVENKPLFAAIGFALVAAFAFGLCQVFSARGAYMHIGAMIGTIMAGNVFFIIIPSQKAMVASAQQGVMPDEAIGKHASLRSLHNNYLTLPVVFVMISNHYPMTFGHAYPWLILLGLFLGSALLRHYLNVTERGQQAALLLPVITLIILVLAYVTAPAKATTVQASEDAIAFADIEAMIAVHCLSCHAETPSNPAFASAPKGIVLETPAHIQAWAPNIMQVSVQSDYMPLANSTGMTPEERERLGHWIAQGANIRSTE